MRAALATVLFGAIVGASRSASAENVKRECVQSATAGQRLRDEGKAVAAREQLVACARAACPGVVRSHCARWLEEVEAAMPSIVVRARAGTAGHLADVTDVQVEIDGKRVAESLDGRPIPVDPGEHAIRYSRTGAAPVAERILLVAGQKNRDLTVEFVTGDANASAATAPGGSSSTADAPSAERSTSSIRPAVWVFGGVAVVAGASFAYLGSTGKSELDDLRSTCAGHCAQSDVSSAWNKLIAADISLGVGIVSAGVATWLLLSPRHTENAPTASETTGFFAAPSAHGTQIGFRGAF